VHQRRGLPDGNLRWSSVQVGCQRAHLRCGRDRSPGDGRLVHCGLRLQVQGRGRHVRCAALHVHSGFRGRGAGGGCERRVVFLGRLLVGRRLELFGRGRRFGRTGHDPRLERDVGQHDPRRLGRLRAGRIAEHARPGSPRARLRRGPGVRPTPARLRGSLLLSRPRRRRRGAVRASGCARSNRPPRRAGHPRCARPRAARACRPPSSRPCSPRASRAAPRAEAR
jgi:hypothetical protein